MDEATRARIEAGLARAAGRAIRVTGGRELAGGASQDLFGLEVVDPESGPARVVLRSDAPRPLPGSIDRRAELAVAEAAVAAGVRTPAPRWLARDLVREGAWSYCLPWVDGEALGAKVVRDPALEGARRELPAQLAGELARIHRVTPGSRPELIAALGEPPADPARAALDALRELVAGLPAREPAFDLVLGWLEAQRPAPGPVVLVHGDFRVGNFLVGPEGLRAVLDWEFAHWGSPAEDLAWIALRDWRFGRLDLPVGGIAPREPFQAAYAAASGRAVDPREVRWWEVCGNLRWAAGSLCQGERYLSGAQRDLELLAVGRRAPEILWESIRLCGGLRPPPPPLLGSLLGAAPGPSDEVTVMARERRAPSVASPPEAAAIRMLERPTAGAVLEAVARFLEEELRPAVTSDKRLAYRCLVAGSLCKSLASELGAPSSRAEGEGWDAVRLRLAERLRAINPRFDLREELP